MSSERTAVEQFVDENPDLAEELEMLRQTVLPGENITFEQKEALYNQAEGISLKNHEEYFLLAVDNELTKQENEEVEKFVLKHPQHQNEYLLLKQTRLEAEPIVFEGKSELYRKEEKEKPVIFLNWMRIGVAAAVIGLAVMLWFFSTQSSKQVSGTAVATTDRPVKGLPQTLPQVEPKSTPVDKNVAAVVEKTAAKAKSKVRTQVNLVKESAPTLKKEVFASNAVKNKLIRFDNLIDEDKKAAEIRVQKKKAFEEAIASAKINDNNSSRDGKGKIVLEEEAPITKVIREQDVPVAKQVVYREINTEEEDEEKSIFIGSTKINKNKLKGLFKKATGFLGARSDDNDGERTLKIAGFEIKSK